MPESAAPESGDPEPAAVAAAWDLLRGRPDAARCRSSGLVEDDGTWVWRGCPDPHDSDAADLVVLLAPVALAGPDLVVAQLGQSLDGRIATRTGDACHVTGEADRRHLHRLRALVDAVVVGVGTVLADDPRLTVRDVPGTDPVRVVLDPRARAPRSSRVLSDGEATMWLVGEDVPAESCAGLPPGVDVVRLPGVGAHRPGRVDEAGVLALLGERGLRRVLVEGGGRTVSSFLAAGLLDRLHLTVAPVLLGDGGVAGLGVPGPALARDALRPPSRAVALGADVCFDLDLR